MSIIKCKECGKDVSDKADICPFCGAPLQSKCLVYGYDQSFLINPMVDVIIDGQILGKISNVKKTPIPLELSIDKDCVIEFKSTVRKAQCPVKAGKITKIKISWNRITGLLQAQEIN